MAKATPCIRVLAGTNGAGKSSIGGEFLRRSGGDYFNPDAAARQIRAAKPQLSVADANGQAWAEGLRRLDAAIRNQRDYCFETTLGGETITRRLEQALDAGQEVRIWYVGLNTVELHLARVAARVQKGGHDIPAADISRRYRNSRLNLIRLLPKLTELLIYDNSTDADPVAGKMPRLQLVLHLQRGKVVGRSDFAQTPEWAKPVVAAALKLAGQR